MSNRTVFMIACVIYSILFFAIGWSAKEANMSDDPIRLVDVRAVLHIIGNAFDDSADFTSADYVRIRRQVEALPTMGQWTPCSKRLPEENMWTICQNNAGAMMIGKYNIEFGWTFPAYFDGIVAWMPLPKPWEGGQDE